MNLSAAWIHEMTTLKKVVSWISVIIVALGLARHKKVVGVHVAMSNISFRIWEMRMAAFTGGILKALIWTRVAGCMVTIIKYFSKTRTVGQLYAKSVVKVFEMLKKTTEINIEVTLL